MLQRIIGWPAFVHGFFEQSLLPCIAVRLWLLHHISSPLNHLASACSNAWVTLLYPYPSPLQQPRWLGRSWGELNNLFGFPFLYAHTLLCRWLLEFPLVPIEPSSRPAKDLLFPCHVALLEMWQTGGSWLNKQALEEDSGGAYACI